MSETRSRVPALGARVIVAVCAVSPAILAGGCSQFNPLNQDDFVVINTPESRLHDIDAVSLREYSQTPPVSIEDATAEMTEEWGLSGLDVAAGSVELTLAEVRAAALANNLDLKVALFDPSIAQTSVDEEEARFESTLTASASRRRNDTPTSSELTGSKVTSDNYDLGVNIPLRNGGTVNVNLPLNRTETNNIFSTLNPSFTSDLRFSISQPLLRNAGVRVNTYGIRVAKYDKQSTDAGTKLEAIRILANADRAYWALYAARQALLVAQDQYELAVAQLERAQRFVDAGEFKPIEVIRARSGVAQRLEGIISSVNLVRQRDRNLKRIMNRPELPVRSEVEILIATEPNPLGLDLDADRVADYAVANRMEMLQLELQLAIAASTIDFEKNQSLPLFTLDYSYNVNGLGSNFGNAFDVLAQKSFEDWSFGMRVEIPLGNEAAKARVHRALLQRVQRLATQDRQELAIRQEVYDAVDQLDTTWQRILAARQAAILAGDTYAAEERQFSAGERTSTDVLNAATELRNAQLSEIRALVDYQNAQVDIAFATGTLLGRDQVRWQAETLPPTDG